MAAAKRFAYYDRLSAKEKAIYRKSDEAYVDIPDTVALAPLVRDLEAALAGGSRPKTARASNALTGAILRQLGVKVVRVRVREGRPEIADGELHGLYTFETEEAEAEIQVWMRTRANGDVVKFRTFLRTLVHEIGHHLDVTLLELDDSFHTQGFFRRESSLVKQLLGEAAPRGDAAPRAPKEAAPEKSQKKRRPSKQLTLF